MAAITNKLIYEVLKQLQADIAEVKDDACGSWRQFIRVREDIMRACLFSSSRSPADATGIESGHCVAYYRAIKPPAITNSATNDASSEPRNSTP
jgi:hypothetical protein